MHKCGSEKELKNRRPVATWIGNTEVLTVEVQGELKVYSGMCPHQGGPLVEGEMTETTVTCPWHGCTFDLSSGKCTDLGVCITGKEMRLKEIPFERKDGDIYVRLEETNASIA